MVMAYIPSIGRMGRRETEQPQESLRCGRPKADGTPCQAFKTKSGLCAGHTNAERKVHS